MKTKMKLYLIIYITIVGFLTACENEIPYNPGQQDPQIIMNALLETGQAENDVYLHLGEGYSIEHLNEATLFLYINGKIAETPKAVSPEEIYGHLENQDQSAKRSPEVFPPHPFLPYLPESEPAFRLQVRSLTQKSAETVPDEF